MIPGMYHTEAVCQEFISLSNLTLLSSGSFTETRWTWKGGKDYEVVYLEIRRPFVLGVQLSE